MQIIVTTYAFKNMMMCEIIIDVFSNPSSSDGFTIVVRDNGNGMPTSFNKEKPESLGWHIINTLVTEDLNGTISVNNLKNGTGQGTEIKIETKINAKQQH